MECATDTGMEPNHWFPSFIKLQQGDTLTFVIADQLNDTEIEYWDMTLADLFPGVKTQLVVGVQQVIWEQKSQGRHQADPDRALTTEPPH